MTSRKRRTRTATETAQPARDVNYRQLKNPFPLMEVFPAAQIADMHQTALRLLEELGLKVLLPEARAIFAQAGARVDEDSEMVYLGRDIIEDALAQAPKSFVGRAGARDRDVAFELGRLCFQAGAGAPNATDLVRGRRPGSASDYMEYLKLTHHFDVFHMISPQVNLQKIVCRKLIILICVESNDQKYMYAYIETFVDSQSTKLGIRLS